MLILSRRPVESIVIGSDPVLNKNIVITILGVKGNQVRIGVLAPREIEVHRLEIYERIQAERLNQSQASE